MNTVNNQRKKTSKKTIERIFVELIQEKELNQISVTDICKLAHINRTTFYNNYIDIYDLADKIKEKLEKDVEELYKEEKENNYNSNDFSKIFKLVQENQLFFKTFFKLEFENKADFLYDTSLSKKFYNDKHIDYHIEFFQAGFNAILRKWLNNGCKESVEEMCEIINSEYQGKLKSSN